MNLGWNHDGGKTGKACEERMEVDLLIQLEYRHLHNYQFIKNSVIFQNRQGILTNIFKSNNFKSLFFILYKNKVPKQYEKRGIIESKYKMPMSIKVNVL